MRAALRRAARELEAIQTPVAAGVAFALFGIFGSMPILLGLALSMRLDETATTAWIFGVMVIAGVATIPLALGYREPYSIGFNIPAAIMLGSAAARYGWPALLGACVATGVVIALGSLVGLGRVSMRFLPLPLVMGMFAGSILRLATDAFAQLGGSEPLIAGSAVIGYFGTRLAFRERVPATLGALVLSLSATAATGKMPEAPPLALSGPQLVLPQVDIGAIVTLVPPLVLLIVGTGNVQAIGFLQTQGYRPPVDRLTFAVGGLTVLNALLGASPSGMARVGAAIVGGPDAGPKERRWVASVIASVLFIAVGLLAIPVSALSFDLPRGLVTTVAGLAVIGALLDAMRITFTGRLAYSSFFALIIAFSPFAPLGLEAAFWSLVGGLAIAWLFEREALLEELRAPSERETPRGER
jgi:benzoate membrane transport protein